MVLTSQCAIHPALFAWHNIGSQQKDGCLSVTQDCKSMQIRSSDDIVQYHANTLRNRPWGINPGKMHTKYTAGFVTNLNAVRPAVIVSLTASKLCVVLLAQVLKPSKRFLITG